SNALPVKVKVERHALPEWALTVEEEIERRAGQAVMASAQVGFDIHHRWCHGLGYVGDCVRTKSVSDERVERRAGGRDLGIGRSGKSARCSAIVGARLRGQESGRSHSYRYSCHKDLPGFFAGDFPANSEMCRLHTVHVFGCPRVVGAEVTW